MTNDRVVSGQWSVVGGQSIAAKPDDEPRASLTPSPGTPGEGWGEGQTPSIKDKRAGHQPE
jgi:hypothetical protein